MAKPLLASQVNDYITSKVIANGINAPLLSYIMDKLRPFYLLDEEEREISVANLSARSMMLEPTVNANSTSNVTTSTTTAGTTSNVN
jgi:hypothetical protein